MAGDPLERYELLFLLGLSWQRLLNDFVERLTAAGYEDLRPVHGFALQVVVRSADVTSSQIGDALGVTKQAAGQLVDHLVACGYVTRGQHPLGGRRRRIVLTERGRRHLQDAGQILHELEADVAGPLGAARLSALRVDLVTLVRSGVPAPTVPPLRPVW